MRGRNCDSKKKEKVEWLFIQKTIIFDNNIIVFCYELSSKNSNEKLDLSQ